MSQQDPEVILATDCGSTTTKAILIKKLADTYRLICRGEAPTTVEAPFEDVTKGVLNSIAEVEDLTKYKIIEEEKIILPREGNKGVDIYVSTSSAGGGLQMMVSGVVKSMTAESAQRAALGGGAIVMDVLATDDGRHPYEKIDRIRKLRPDMMLVSGGTDGGTITHIVEMLEYVSAADPKPRFGLGYKLPIIFAGNKNARQEVERILKDKFELYITENIRPTLETENLMPARHRIHEIFLEHVMMQAPGYAKLMSWVSAPIMPTPAAVGLIMEKIAKKWGINIIGVDIGGATTDTFSVFDGIFNRTVSANLGMSYSISNVLAEAGAENIFRWIPFKISEQELQNRIKNKMIRPTTVPHTLEDLITEHAISREALRLAFEQHKSLAVGLKGLQQRRTVADVFEQVQTGQTLINMLRCNLIVGSGGVLSHAPRRNQSMLMMIDAYQPIGVSQLAVDSIFMMPHLGVLSTVHEKAATDVFVKDCMIYLGTCVAPIGVGKEGQKCLKISVHKQDGTMFEDNIPFGELRLYPLALEESAGIEIYPYKPFDVGEGAGKPLRTKVYGGVVGLVVDTRGRPLVVPKEEDKRRQCLRKWFGAINAYPIRNLW